MTELRLGNQVAVKKEDGYIWLMFKDPAKMVRFDPQATFEVAMRMVAELTGAQNPQAVSHAILEYAYKKQYKSDPAPETNLNVEAARTKLHARVAHMLKTFHNQQPMPSLEIMAVQIVDRCLQEAT